MVLPINADGGFAAIVGSKPFIHASFCIIDRCEAIERHRVVRGVDEFTIADEGRRPCGTISRGCNFVIVEPRCRWHLRGKNWQIVRACKIKVSLIATWYSHDGASAVAHEDIVSDEDRNLAAGDRVRCHCAGEHACLLF
jgi:hypothetical protein